MQKCQNLCKCNRAYELTGARWASRLGLALGTGSDAETDEPWALLASFISFFHETYVVSPRRSSTLSNFRSAAANNFGEVLDDSPSVAALCSPMEWLGRVRGRVCGETPRSEKTRLWRKNQIRSQVWCCEPRLLTLKVVLSFRLEPNWQKKKIDSVYYPVEVINRLVD